MKDTTDTARNGTGRDGLKALALALGLPIIIALMLYAFLAPSFSSGSKDLPLAVTGPAVELVTLEQALRSESPNAFAFEHYGDAAGVREAVEGRDAVGGIVLESQGQLTIYTAAGNGSPYPELLSTMAAQMQAQGQTVETVELAPLTEDDPGGIGLAMLSLPLAFGGMASAALMIVLLRGKTLQTLVCLTATSIPAGFLVASILQYGYGSFEANLLVSALVIAAGVAATSFFVTGLGALVGVRAIGIGAILTIFIANPLSGLATGWWWLPEPWGEIGRHLPIGAAGHLLRSYAFFDGNGADGAWAALIVWILAGAVLIIGVGLRRRGRLDASPAKHQGASEGRSTPSTRELAPTIDAEGGAR